MCRSRREFAGAAEQSEDAGILQQRAQAARVMAAAPALERRLVTKNAAWEHRKEALAAEEAAVAALEAQAAALAGGNLAEQLAAAAARRDEAAAAHERCAPLPHCAPAGAPYRLEVTPP